MTAAPTRVNAVLGKTQDPVHYDPRANSSAGQMITWVFIPLIGISSAFAYERQRGTLRRLLTTPTNKGYLPCGDHPRQRAVGAGADDPADDFWSPGDESKLGGTTLLPWRSC